MFRSQRLRIVLVFAAVMCVALTFAAMDLMNRVKVVYDENGVPTIRAKSELDAIYMLGYLHARDRFFQMDVQRRAFSGTLAELLGPSVLPQDVQLRTLGLRRAAERSLAVQTPESMAWLEAYSDGVNAWLQSSVYESQDGTSCGSASSDSDDESNSASNSHASNSSSDSSSELADPIFNSLPVEYTLLETNLDGIAEWTPVDSLTMAKGLAWTLSFDLGDIDRTLALLNFLGVGEILGFNGLQLYSADLYRTAPFDPTVSINSAPPSGGPEWPEPQVPSGPGQLQDMMGGNAQGGAAVDEGDYSLASYLTQPNLVSMLQEYRDTAANIPMLLQALEQDHTQQGSNWFVASGALTESGFPMLANDPHLGLDTPATFYEAHLDVKHGINVTGSTFPGVPGVVVGCNETICWGATVNSIDVTDVYQEVLLALGPDPTQPTHTYRVEGPEPLQFIPQTFLFNAIGDTVPNTLIDAGIPPTSGGVTLVVPRRNDGPIVQVSVDPSSPTPITGISVQYVGWGATQELETFRRFARAESTQDFEEALQFFDVGSQNFSYADVHGNIAYYTSGELPIREDLQNPPFVPAGLQPPYFIRDGTHTLKHDWQPLTNPQPQQSLSTEILPFSEMPQVVNPPGGLILNANNDPIGTTLDGVSWNEFRAGFNGRLYLASGYATGLRMGRIRQLFDDALAAGPLTREQFKTIQANNQLLDAEVFVPFLLDAFTNASASATPALSALAADAEVAEAIGRLGGWDFSTPTGIPEGFDPFDALPLPAPSQQEIDASVAATIFSVWRGQVVQRVVDQTLASLPVPLDGFAPGTAQSLAAVRNLLDNYPINGGVGQSLINFFNEPGAGAGFYDRRDLVLLRALRNALDLLASDEFAPAFGNSTAQEDYRWGKLHRIVLAHPLGGPFNIPPAGSPANLSWPDLPGFARAGGLGAVDASAHSARADGLQDFMFDAGPARRVVATMDDEGPDVIEVLPGGESGVPGSPFQTDQLNLWLVNDYHPLPLSKQEVYANAVSCQTLVPPPGPPGGHAGVLDVLGSSDGAGPGAMIGLDVSDPTAQSSEQAHGRASEAGRVRDKRGTRPRRR